MRHNRTGIINTALMRVGAQGVTAAFQDAPVAQAAAAAYDRSLAYCLSLHAWSFALRQTVLARSAQSPASGPRRAYPLPADCLRVVDVFSSGPLEERRISYELAGDALQTHADNVTLIYVSAEAAAFSEAFAEALAWRVALEIAPYVQQGGGNMRDYLEMFEAALDRARAENDIRQRPARLCRSSFLKERMVL